MLDSLLVISRQDVSTIPTCVNLHKPGGNLGPIPGPIANEMPGVLPERGLVTAPNKEQLLTKVEVAAYLRVSLSSVNRHMLRGMPYMRLSSRAVRFSLDQVLTWLAGRSSQHMSKREVL